MSFWEMFLLQVIGCVVAIMIVMAAIWIFGGFEVLEVDDDIRIKKYRTPKGDIRETRQIVRDLERREHARRRRRRRRA